MKKPFLAQELNLDELNRVFKHIQASIPNPFKTVQTPTPVENGGGVATESASSHGGVSSVGLAMPAQFAVSGSPVTASGVLTAAWANESANTALLGPASGPPATPTFRALTLLDTPLVEPALGNPPVNGYLLSSTTAGVRSWIAPGVGGGGGQVATTIGDGVSTTIAFTHNLGSTDVAPTVWELTGLLRDVTAGVEIRIVDSNNIRLVFLVAPASNSLRLIVTLGGGFQNPMTTLGDLVYESATPAATRLAGNTTASKQFLTQTGTGSVSAPPAWGAIVSGDLATAMTTPPPIGGTTPSTGNFTYVTQSVTAIALASGPTVSGISQTLYYGPPSVAGTYAQPATALSVSLNCSNSNAGRILSGDITAFSASLSYSPRNGSGSAYGANISVTTGVPGATTIPAVYGAKVSATVGSTLTTASLYGVYASANTTLAAVVTNAYAIYATNSIHTSTTVNSYGLYVDNIGGATNTYAIFTNAGLVSFGDNVSIAASKGLTLGDGAPSTTTNTLYQAAGLLYWNGALVSGGGGMTNPMTTLGDIIYENATPAPARLAGNTTTTQQVLTSTGTGAAANAPVWTTLPTFSYYDPDAPSPSPTSQDDDFDSSVLNARWTTVNNGSLSSTDINTTVPSSLYAVCPNLGTTIPAWLQPLPAGDFTTCIKGDIENDGTSNNAYIALILSTTNTSGTGSQIVVALWNTGTGREIGVYTWSNFNSAGSSVYSSYLPIRYIRVRRSGSSYYFGGSMDGKTWSDSLFSPGFTPSYFGIAIYNNSTGSARASVEFFRYFANSLTLQGKTRTVYGS